MTDAAFEPLMAVEDLRVEYPPSRAARDAVGRGRPVRALDGVSLEIRPGEVVALVGESGSGKTTLAQALTRLVEPVAGRVLHHGRDITHLGGAELRRLRRGFQIVFQDPYESLDPRQTVEETITEPLRIHAIGASVAERREIVLSALRSVGLEPAAELASRFPHQLSGGQRQRVSIAAAMVLQPELVVADEPVSMLDVSVRSGILRLMLDLRAERGFAYLFVTHDLSLAWVFADRIAVLYLGRIVESGSADEVIRRPRHPYTRALVSVIPIPDPAARREQVVLVGETPSPTNVPPGCRFHPRCPLRSRLGSPPICEQVDPRLEPEGPPGRGEPSAGGAVHAPDRHMVACHFKEESPDVRR